MVDQEFLEKELKGDDKKLGEGKYTQDDLKERIYCDIEADQHSWVVEERVYE